MSQRSYNIDIPEIDIEPDFGVRFIGINKENPAGFENNHCGIPALFFLQMQTAGFINGSPVKELATIIWSPGKAHIFGSETQTWFHSWIKFMGENASTIMEEYKIPLNSPFYLQKKHLFEKYCTLIHEEIRTHVNPDMRIIENTYRNFLMEIERDLLDSESSQMIPEKIQKVKALIDTKYYINLNLKTLSEESFMAPNYLTSEFKRYFGLSIINYLIQIRIFHAETLLGNLKLTIGEIAEEVGYRDLQHFSKLFKKHRGKSPTDYRKSLNSITNIPKGI